MTWWDTVLAFLQNQYTLLQQNSVNFANGMGFNGVLNGITDTASGIAQVAGQVLPWIPQVVQLLPILLVLWFLDVSITALQTGEIRPLGQFITIIAQILVGIGGAIASALPL